MYNFYRWYNVLFFTYLYGLLGPFNIITLLYVGVSGLFFRRENFFQSLTNHIRAGGTICNTHLLVSIAVNELLKNQSLQRTWRNIHSKLYRIYSSQDLKIIDSKILPFQCSDRGALLAGFLLRVGARGPEYWKLGASILCHGTFRMAFQNFWQEYKQQQKDY